MPKNKTFLKVCYFYIFCYYLLLNIYCSRYTFRPTYLLNMYPTSLQKDNILQSNARSQSYSLNKIPLIYQSFSNLWLHVPLISFSRQRRNHYLYENQLQMEQNQVLKKYVCVIKLMDGLYFLSQFACESAKSSHYVNFPTYPLRLTDVPVPV